MLKAASWLVELKSERQRSCSEFFRCYFLSFWIVDKPPFRWWDFDQVIQKNFSCVLTDSRECSIKRKYNLYWQWIAPKLWPNRTFFEANALHLRHFLESSYMKTWQECLRNYPNIRELQWNLVSLSLSLSSGLNDRLYHSPGNRTIMKHDKTELDNEEP